MYVKIVNLAPRRRQSLAGALQYISNSLDSMFQRGVWHVSAFRALFQSYGGQELANYVLTGATGGLGKCPGRGTS